MNTRLLYLAVLTFFFLNTFSQNEQCATMKNLQNMFDKDPALKLKIDELERQTQLYVESKRVGLVNYNPYKEPSYQKTNNTQGITSLCGYNNTSFTVIAAPTTLNQKVSPNPNCTYGGEYVTVNGLIGGRTYKISTCGLNNFDTQLTIYTQGGGTAVAHNDDWCGAQSEIYFTPINNGNYDILVDAFNCANNSICANLEVELWYIPRQIITIPVVVHVVHFGEAIGIGRNISDAQINSQIAALNEDYRRLNFDINTVPAAFRGASSDALIEFCLAKQDEFGNPTTGIKRYLGTQATWDVSQIETSIKPPTIWDRNKYLNLWTLEFGGADVGTLGYAQFPGMTANTDGVVMLFNAFGTVGNVQTNYDLGRTCTHEVGHWLNLRHIWGDESACAADDFVSDTPLQEVSSSGCQTFPVLTDACTVNYPGIMFMNYMDYGYHQCRRMYTYGQFVRMDATLFGARSSLLSSQGCVPSTIGINENSALDNAISLFPNPSNGNITLKVNLSQQLNLHVSVYSILGSKVLEYNYDNSNSENFIIDLKDKSNGVYFVRINSNGQSITKKIVLNKQNQ